jgi:hypothetical protein
MAVFERIEAARGAQAGGAAPFLDYQKNIIILK